MYSQFLKYCGVYIAKAVENGCTTEECPHKPMAPQTSAETFGISHCLTASQACHVQEVQSSDPCMELNHYLSDPLEQPGINMFCFWMVSFPLLFQQCN